MRGAEPSAGKRRQLTSATLRGAVTEDDELWTIPCLVGWRMQNWRMQGIEK